MSAWEKKLRSMVEDKSANIPSGLSPMKEAARQSASKDMRLENRICDECFREKMKVSLWRAQSYRVRRLSWG